MKTQVEAVHYAKQMGAALVNRAVRGGVPCSTEFLTAITDAFWESAAKQSRIEQPIIPVVVDEEQERRESWVHGSDGWERNDGGQKRQYTQEEWAEWHRVWAPNE